MRALHLARNDRRPGRRSEAWRRAAVDGPCPLSWRTVRWFSSQITPRCLGLPRSALGSTDPPPTRSSRWRVPQPDRLGKAPVGCSHIDRARRQPRAGFHLGHPEDACGRVHARCQCSGHRSASVLFGKIPGRVAPGGNRGHMGAAAASGWDRPSPADGPLHHDPLGTSLSEWDAGGRRSVEVWL